MSMRGLILVMTCVLSTAAAAQCPDGSAPPCRGVRPPSMSVAVLPFRNIGPDTSQQYFADGIADAVLNGLAQLPGVKVTARSSSFSFRNRDIDARLIGESLGVAKLVEGSVTKIGDRVRVSARLFEAASGQSLWAESIDRTVADLFELQDTVSRAIASRLGAAAASGTRLVNRTTTSAAAQDHYLRGKELLYRRDPASLVAAMEKFRLAIRADARHAPAWAGLSQSSAIYANIQVWASANKATPGDSAYRLYGRAFAAANRAIELDSLLPEGWGVRGYMQLYTSGPTAEPDLRRAIQLRPSYAEAHGWLGQRIVIAGGSAVDARAERDKAVELDPASIGMRLGNTLTTWGLRDYQGAFDAARAIRVLRPEFAAVTAQYEGPALIALGRPEECLQITASQPMANAMCLVALGRRKDAAAQIDSLLRVWDSSRTAAYLMTGFLNYYGMTGEAEEFITWLRRSYERGPIAHGLDDNGGLSDPVLKAEGGRVRTSWLGMKQAAWDRIVRESRAAKLP